MPGRIAGAVAVAGRGDVEVLAAVVTLGERAGEDARGPGEVVDDGVGSGAVAGVAAAGGAGAVDDEVVPAADAGRAVDVDDVEQQAGAEADVRLRGAGPPGVDPLEVGGGVVEPVPVLTASAAALLPVVERVRLGDERGLGTGAQGEDGDPVARVPAGGAGERVGGVEAGLGGVVLGVELGVVGGELVVRHVDGRVVHVGLQVGGRVAWWPRKVPLRGPVSLGHAGWHRGREV